MPFGSPSSIAREFFEKITTDSDPFAYLSGIPYPPRPEPFYEDEWIEFKTNPQLKETKRIWSKALSAFANTTDGLVIWGIKAEKDPATKIDAAIDIDLIPTPRALEFQLREWIRDATNPPVMGVEFRSYFNPKSEGFVVCLIPESRYKPHRAEFSNGHYYYRAGDDSLQAGPGLLRTLFFQNLNPYFEIEVELRYEFNPVEVGHRFREERSDHYFTQLVNKAQSSMEIRAFLTNTGVATGKEVYVVVNEDRKLRHYAGPDWHRRENLQGKAYLANRSIHPNERSHLLHAEFPVMFENRVAPNNPNWVIPQFDPVLLKFLIYADNFQGQALSVQFAPEDFNTETQSTTKIAELKI